MLLARIAKKKYNLGGRGDYVAKRSAAGTRDIVLYILRTWRLRSEAKCRRDA